MKTGKVPRSMELPAGELVPSFAPDGLTEAAIDELIAEVSAEVSARPRPVWLSADQVETRRSRRLARSGVRSLTGVMGSGKSTLILTTLLSASVDWDEVA
ncbi:MAG TPA: hypothetical protein VF444_23095 [Pseudonocardiaceae bacterium]